MIVEEHELVKPNKGGLTIKTYEFPDMDATFHLGWDPKDEEKRLEVTFRSHCDSGEILIKLPNQEKPIDLCILLGVAPYWSGKEGYEEFRKKLGLGDEDLKVILRFVQKKCIDHAKQLLDWVEMDETWNLE